MKALLALLLAGAASPAFAQHSAHAAPAPTTAPSTACTAEHAAMGHCTLPPPAQPEAAPAAPPEQQSSSCSPEHAAMGHCTPPASTQQPAQPADPHAGHDMPGQTTPSKPEPPESPPPAAALQGPENAADQFWGRQAMERSRKVLRKEHGDIPAYKILVDQFEARMRKGPDGYFLNAEAWYGGDIDKIWLKAEIEGDFKESPEQAEVQALWSHAIDPWFDLQTGIRHDAHSGSGRTHLVVGIQGLAPYWIEVDAAAFLSDKGDVTARFEAEHDMRITQKLILQPRIELDFALQDIPDERLGAGLSVAELGARLRYQVTQQFAPYIGVEYDRAFGDTRRFRRLADEDPGGLSFVAGLRIWF